MSTIASSQRRLAEQGFDGLEFLKGSLVSSRPWDSIIDFASHPSFCGKKLYPRQKTLLKLIHLETENMTAYDIDVIEEWRTGFLNKNQPEGVQPDIWERVDYLKNNGYTHFPHVQAVLGRRASKGVIGGLVGAERIAYFYSLDDWQDHYGITPGKDGFVMVVATNQTQASRFQFADIRETIEGCNYLKPHISTSKDGGLTVRTPADRRLISKMRADGIPIDREIASLHVLPIASSSASGRGGVNLCLDPKTEILMSDGTKKLLKDIVVGDILKGVEEFGEHQKLETEVLAKATVEKPAYRITFEDGSSVVCSESHKWLDENGVWRESSELEVGDGIWEF